VLDAAALRARLAGVRQRIADAASRTGRDPAAVRLVAVSKTFPAEHLRAVFEAGQVDFGENRVQEAVAKIRLLSDLPLAWHLIGHLQSNKARKAAETFQMIHSVDDLSLLQKLDQAADAAGRTIELLVQVDLVGEPTKSGVRPEALMPMFTAAAACRAARVSGLMLLPPMTADPEGARPFFAELRHLRDRLLAAGVGRELLAELSMGMSHDFEVAIEEGATIVRVGRAIFGERSRR
jgi:pyridoxal phosphate enzyme (YggS family)